jgi:hypothetical protein
MKDLLRSVLERLDDPPSNGWRLMRFALTCLQSSPSPIAYSLGSGKILMPLESIHADGTDPAPLLPPYSVVRGSETISLETCLRECEKPPLTLISEGGSSLTIRDGIVAPFILMTYGALTRTLSATSHHWHRARFATLITNPLTPSTRDVLLTFRCTTCGMTIEALIKRGWDSPTLSLTATDKTECSILLT